MTPDTPTFYTGLGRTVARHSLGWLLAANLVGLWLAVSLLWPSVGNMLAPLTFGRWAPVHMNWQLYGWCSLPLVGALLAWCGCEGEDRPRGGTRLALGSWSAALLLGGLAWLGGSVSGKLFLDWHGWSRPLLPAAMVVLWCVLVLRTGRDWRQLRTGRRIFRAGILGALLFVPPVLFWATGRGMYHPVNPDSGGATGAAILGSSLGIISIYMLVPAFLGLAAIRSRRLILWALAASWLVFAVIDRGSVSHHVTAQILALALLLLWIPLLPLYWRNHHWSPGAGRWLVAAAAWWALLAVTGWLSFLPGLSERLKFTHALVGHAHLAMAGFITSCNAAILVTLVRRSAPRSVFWLWQAGCVVHVGAMLVLGWLESDRIGDLYRGEAWTQALLGLRLTGGLAMAAGSARWLGTLLRQ